MTAGFVVYVDESGDEGFSFDHGSSEWFILSAVITQKASDLVTVKLVDSVRARLGKPPKKPLHFRDLRHEQRLPFVDAIAQADLRTVTILVHKPSIQEPEKFQERYRLYFYAVRYLFERVSWYCRDRRRAGRHGDKPAEIFFSNRAGMAYSEMRDYLRLLEERTALSDVRIDWSVISPAKIRSFSAGKLMGLQIADAVAGSFFYAVEVTRHGFTESRYARMLRPSVYHHRGRHLGYGVKVWPRDVPNLLRAESRFEWLLDYDK